MTQETIEIEPAVSDETFDFEFDPSTLTIKMDYKIVGDNQIHQHLTSLSEPEHINGQLALLDVGEKAKICINGKNKKWLYVM